MTKKTILEEIVEAKLAQLVHQKESMPIDSLKRQITSSDRSFATALKSPSPGFILECKKASPSKGVIREDFDLVSIAKTYGKYASAISVLTEADYFLGSLSNLGIMRNNAPQPILAKDFFVDSYQVYQSRHFGADAILLILAILDDQQWRELFQLARSMDMDVVTEVSNADERQRAVALGAPIIGINNRDLRDMSINLETTRQLSAGLPEDTIVISESGYYTHRQVREMNDCANAFLIGSSLMSEKRLATAVKRMIFGESKVCGLTRNEDAVAADLAGAVYGGVIFADSSPRKIKFEDVDLIFKGTELLRVGVFQDHSAIQIADIATRCRLDVIQLHGDETPDLVYQLKKSLPERLEYWKAITIQQWDQDSQVWLNAGVERLVVDNHKGEIRGGTGETFEWQKLPGEHRDRIIIAGGIGPENVGGALGLRCAGIDMNSRLEEGPGFKSADKINQAFNCIRDYHTSHA